jgi:hypothetical protein
LKKSTEFNNFNAAMGAILKADPKAVKAAVDAEIQAHTAERKAKGERKRGRKPKAQRTTSALDRASTSKG